MEDTQIIDMNYTIKDCVEDYRSISDKNNNKINPNLNNIINSNDNTNNLPSCS